jgi:N-methylhydantoinase B
MHVALNAACVAMQALSLATGASLNPRRHEPHLEGASWGSAIATQLWSWTDAAGKQDAFLALDGMWVGGSAGSLRDGNDLGRDVVGPAVEGSFPDIEVLESWFPLLFLERRSRLGAGGAGQFRAGGGNGFSFRPHGVAEIVGTIFGMRRWLPLQGLAGGRPGACNELLVHHADGSSQTLELAASGTVVREGDWYEMRLGSGGGYGDPLDRDVAAVERDVSRGRIDAEVARRSYGVVIGDRAATIALREAMRRERLSHAEPARKPLAAGSYPISGDTLPLYPGVVQRGAVAVAELSGALLARAPDHWTDGCPLLIERRGGKEDPDIYYRTWLDPQSGRSLHVEAVVGDAERSFEVTPRRWIDAAA